MFFKSLRWVFTSLKIITLLIGITILALAAQWNNVYAQSDSISPTPVLINSDNSHMRGSVLYENGILGVAITYPIGYEVLEDQYLSSEYGFIIVDSQRNPILDVSWLHQATLQKQDRLMDTAVEEATGIDVIKSPITFGAYQGSMLAPMPGVVANTLVYISANGRLYTFRYYEATLDELGHSLLESVDFYPSHQSLESLHLLDSDDVLHALPDSQDASDNPNVQEVLEAAAAQIPLEPGATTIEVIEGIPDDSSLEDQSSANELSMPDAGIGPLAVASGCVAWSGSVRTQWTLTANDDGSYDGYSWAGPSFYGEGSHVDCNSNTNYNDYYALDHQLEEWNLVNAPRSGTVIMAGWAKNGWCTLGRTVIIDHGTNHWSVSAHLRSISSSITVGSTVTTGTLIGFAGGSGCDQDNYWGVHLHESITYQAILSTSNGVPVGIYGGSSVRPSGYKYVRGRGGVYRAADLYRGQLMSY